MKLYRFLLLVFCTSICLSIADAGSQTRSGLPYKVYTATVSQSGTADPVATVLQNTIGANPLWERTAVGTYHFSFDGSFPSGKTAIITSPDPAGKTHPDHLLQCSISGSTTGFILFFSGDLSAAADDVMKNDLVEIRVYP